MTPTLAAAAAAEHVRHDTSWADRPTRDDWTDPHAWERPAGPITYANPAWGDPFTRGGITDAGRRALGVTG